MPVLSHSSRRWLLPEGIEDVLPREACWLETLRRRLLDLFRVYGYELVQPPLLEYLDSLLTGTGRDMDLRTVKLVDQLSGRSMGVRADITPQVARIDAHLLNRPGVTRLCYCGSVLHAVPAGLSATREPLQIGAELYGHGGVEADVEILRLLAAALDAAGVPSPRLDIGHVGLFRALTARAGIDAELEEELFGVLEAKDVPTLRELVAGVAEPVRSALLALPECYGGVEALDAAAQALPGEPEISAALDELRFLARVPNGVPVGFDLADLRGYHYHSGVVFAAYSGAHPGAIALGGRYDHVGAAFGRGRPATGFSMDLRAVAGLVDMPAHELAIAAPHRVDAALDEAVAVLRNQGEVVIVALSGHEDLHAQEGCDRRLERRGGRWVVVPIQGE